MLLRIIQVLTIRYTAAKLTGSKRKQEKLIQPPCKK